MTTVTINDIYGTSDEPGIEQSFQVSPSLLGGPTHQELESMSNQRFPTGSSRLLSPSATSGSWQDVYRLADPDAQRQVFDQQLTEVTGCGFVAEGAARPQPQLNPLYPSSCAGVGHSGQVSTQQSRFS